ncbi:hypothetical protein B0H16DRAFT_1448652 [Mycena metata]|uniref:Uncharacterized protein n=1 Tax=Mycena metata TaxID=1033252 RepID=A0AAD7K604_9AGAR|nr:hypothetical protein B0H16DRAFT_1448652 [Mycena metata]
MHGYRRYQRAIQHTRVVVRVAGATLATGCVITKSTGKAGNDRNGMEGNGGESGGVKEDGSGMYGSAEFARSRGDARGAACGGVNGAYTVKAMPLSLLVREWGATMRAAIEGEGLNRAASRGRVYGWVNELWEWGGASWSAKGKSEWESKRNKSGNTAGGPT